MAAEMRLYRLSILGWLLALGCVLMHALPAAASTRDAPENYNLLRLQQVSAVSPGPHASRLASAWAQGVALPGTDAHAPPLGSAQDDETVFHRVRHSMGAVSEQAVGVWSRPTPKLGGLVLVLLTVFALVLGFLSLRWHRETAQ
ncbi:hypothetical protein [Comamonas sp.]|uniref:hypothetical protein n=1 Tax=Comamonas sp. TaxID=34028 RepID=UPI0028A5C2D4|nr:hypothetical protein [Comamonas sp.]